MFNDYLIIRVVSYTHKLKNMYFDERMKAMFFKILKKDLKRSRTMNTILFLFIILASLFVSSGLSNLFSVVKGMDYFLEEAVGDKDDYFLLVNSGKDDSNLHKVLDESEKVKSYACDKWYSYIDEVYTGEGEKLAWSGAIMLESPETTYIKLFDSDNKKISSVEKGHIYLSVNFMNDFDLKAGDKVRLKLNKEEKEYIIDGGLKDAFLGSSISGMNRFYMNDEDAKLYFDSDKDGSYSNSIAYIETDDIEGVTKALSEVEGAGGSFARDTVILTRIVEMLVAFIVVILSVCLIIVSFVILRFSIGFTIQDDFREIGVMKAIGIRNFKIRRLYLIKYLAISLVSVVIGCALSFPFGNLMIESVSKSMMLGNDYGMMINIAGSVIVFVLIMWLAFLSTGKVKKMTPVDAIRSGETGERFRKKRGIRIGKSHLKNSAYLAWNDILSSPKRYLNIIISIGICATFLLILANLTRTLDSNAFIDTFSVRADLYMQNEDPSVLDIDKLIDKYSDVEGIEELKNEKQIDPDVMKKYKNGKAIYADYLKLIEEKLASEGMPAKVYNDIIYSYKFSYEGEEYTYSFIQVAGNGTGKYPMTEGDAPQNKNEIAFTQAVEDSYGMKIGDTIEVDFGGTKEKCTITGKFQSMNNLGAMMRIHDDVPTDLKDYTGYMNTLITFTDNPDEKTIEERKDKIKEMFNADSVKNQKQECVDNMGTLDAMEAVEMLLMIITILVIILVTIMMERSFIIREKKQIAILKAVGFRNSDVIGWHVIRFGILGVIAVLLAVAISIPLTNVAGGAIFSMMGATSIKFMYSIIGLLKYPILLVAVTVLITRITSLYTGSIKARDTASIE